MLLVVTMAFLLRWINYWSLKAISIIRPLFLINRSNGLSFKVLYKI